MKLTRDGTVWLLFLIVGVLGFLGGHFELLTKAFPSFSASGQAKIELFSAILGFVGGYLRMSPVSLSPGNVMASPQSDKTLGPAGGLTPSDQIKKDAQESNNDDPGPKP